MADKEAVVYIIDVGKSMGKFHNGRNQSDLEFSMQYVWDKITTAVSTERKTLFQAVIGLKTNETENDLKDQAGYEHISVFQGLQQVLLPDLRNLKECLVPSKTEEGDAISAIAIAVQMIMVHCKQLKYIRRIVLVTNGHGQMDADGLDEIAKPFLANNIELVVIGVDFDDPEYGVKEEDKSPSKAHNEANLRQLTEKCNGIFGTMSQAIEELGEPRLKAVRPIASFKDPILLNDPGRFHESHISIAVERYPRVMVARAKTASSFAVQPQKSQGTQSQAPSSTQRSETNGQSENQLIAIHNARAYFVEDNGAVGGKRDVPFEELEKGYEYGRTAVHISASDEGITTLETNAALELMGFIPRENYERFMGLSTSNIIIPQKGNTKAGMAFSSLVHALYELETYGIGRLVTKKDKPPVLVILAPSIEPDYECLIDIQLPFAEDVRQHRFAPLDKVVTVSGKVLKQHRLLPNDDLLAAVSDYVDRMDLTKIGGESGYLDFNESFCPHIHRIDSAIRHRAIFPDKPLPEPAPILTRFQHPPSDLLENVRSDLDTLIKIADLKKVPPKVIGRKRVHESVKPLSGLDVDALLGKEKRVKISMDNSIPEFKQALASTSDPDGIHKITKQMGEIILSRFDELKPESPSFLIERIVEEMSALRLELIDYEEPGVYNSWMKDGFKGKVKGGIQGDGVVKIEGDERGEKVRALWNAVRRARLGLVTEKDARGLATEGLVSESAAWEYWDLAS